MNLWKINIKTAADDGKDPKSFCLEEGIIGVGWPVGGFPTTPKPERYLKAARKRYARNGKKMPSALNAITTRVKVNDLVWLRDNANVFHLGRVTGEWEYVSYDGKADKWDQHDIHNFRKVEWHRVGTVDHVPWGIVKQFSRGTLAKIKEGPMLEFSKFTYNQLPKNDKQEAFPGYKLQRRDEASLFNFIGPEDCEDVVALYLQEELGYHLLPSTCKSSTKHYEFVFVHPENKVRAVAQVKNGKETLLGSNYKQLNKPDSPGGVTKVFLFTLGACDAKGQAHVECLDPAKLEDWIRGRESLWSGKLRRWMEMMGEVVKQEKRS